MIQPIHINSRIEDYQPFPDHPIIGTSNIPLLSSWVGQVTGLGFPDRGWWVDVYGVVKWLKGKGRTIDEENVIHAINMNVVEEICHFFGWLHLEGHEKTERAFLMNLEGL